MKQLLRNLIFALSLSAALLVCSSCTPANFDQASATVLAVAKKEIIAASQAHKVSVNADQIAFGSNQNLAVAAVSISGIERYREADFTAGVPIQLLIVSSSTTPALPNGSYVVKAQFKPGETSGKAIFTDRTGAVVTQKDLIIRTWEQSSVLFPDAYPIPKPEAIPVITSTHVVNPPNKPSGIYVDCSGLFNGNTAYYPM